MTDPRLKKTAPTTSAPPPPPPLDTKAQSVMPSRADGDSGSDMSVDSDIEDKARVKEPQSN